MAEGGTSEIPQHLIESVLSVEAHEQQVRREVQIDDYARKRQIPKESMDENATVQRYVTVLRDADAAATRLGVGHHPQIHPVLEDSPEGARERTSQAGNLYLSELMILEEGFQTVMDGG
jgi:hypothetical protein